MVRNFSYLKENIKLATLAHRSIHVFQMKKNVLIIGAFHKAGIAMAAAFRVNGFYVYGADQKEDYEGICGRAFRFDVGEFASDAGYRVKFSRIFDEIIPRLDALVVCEANSGQGRLKDIQLDDWHRCMDENVTGPMLLCKLFQSRLEKSNGAILFVGSEPDLLVKPKSVAFQAARQAVLGLAKAVAGDLNGKTTVNSLCTNPAFLPDGKANKAYWNEVAEMAAHLVKENKMALNGKAIIMDGKGGKKGKL